MVLTFLQIGGIKLLSCILSFSMIKNIKKRIVSNFYGCSKARNSCLDLVWATSISDEGLIDSAWGCTLHWTQEFIHWGAIDRTYLGLPQKVPNKVGERKSQAQPGWSLMECCLIFKRKVAIEGYQARNLDVCRLRDVIRLSQFGSIFWYELTRHWNRPSSLSLIYGFACTFSDLGLFTPNTRNYDTGWDGNVNRSVSSR